LQILKLYAWEMAFGDKVTEVRKKELAILLKEQFIYGFFTFAWSIAPFLVSSLN